MTFRPNPGDELIIGDKVYRVAEHPAAPGMAYGQTGRRGTVYQLIDEEDGAWALKVFQRRFREPRLVGQAERIASFVDRSGLKACERRVLTSRRDVELMRKHRELAYAVLMPWIPGRTWMEMVLGGEVFSPQDSLHRARSLADVLAGLEEYGLAHCDFSGPNLIVTPERSIELVDLEEMYGPGLVEPEVFPGGSPGYAHRTAPEGLWHAKADRFAGAVLLAEMLGWCDERVREAAWGEGYFDPDEMQTNCERYHNLKSIIEERWGSDLPSYLDQMWFSDSLVDCPTFTEWLAAVPDEVPALEELAAAGVKPELKIEEDQHQDELGLEEEAPPRIEEMEVEEPMARIEEEVWTCPVCEREVGTGLDVCPYCEKGRRDEGDRLEMLPEAELEVPAAEAERRRMPLLAVAAAIIAVVILGGGIGGTVIRRSQDAKSTAAAIALVATRTQAAAETATARPSDTPTETATLTFTPTQTPTVTTTPTPTLGVGSTIISDADGMVMAYVPEGSFLMGSTSDDPDAYDDEFPQHEVYLDAFWIDQTEVTNAMYALCEDDGVCGTPRYYTSNLPSSYYGNSSYDEYPVINASWYQAQDYCQWVGRRLPTEAEWEKAARGDDGRIYPWGDESPSCNLANNRGCVWDMERVGSYVDGASQYGALDMAGNVGEWVADWYDSDYYDISPSENPSGPSSGDRRVERGGSWLGYPKPRAAYRTRVYPIYSYNSLGFRCARGTSQ